MTVFARRSRLAILAAACLVVLLVLGAVGLGLRLPGLGFLDGPLDRTRLDYQSRFGGGYAPLRDGFVDARLGGSTSEPPDAARSTAAAGASSAPPPVSIQHEATNDDFTDAYEVPSIPIAVRTTTSKATREREEPGNCSIVGSTVWYRYTPSRDTRIVVDTFGTRYSDALAVYRGSSLSDLQPVACDKGATGNAQVSYLARAGVPHYFQVTGVAGGGQLTFNVQPLGVTQRLDEPTTSSSVRSPVDFGAPAVSENGRYIAFVTQKAPCVPGETCLFIRDVDAGATTMLISTHSDAATPGDNYISDIAISGDGRTIAFSSQAPNFVPDDTNRLYDVFVIDRISRRIERVSETSAGDEAQTPPTGVHRRTYPMTYSGSAFPSVSWDGRFVSFISDADNLDPRARSGEYSTYVHDRRTGRTELASVDAEGEAIREAFNRYGNALSGDGRRVVFSDLNGKVSVRDRELGTTIDLGSGSSPVISNDGRRVAFVHTNERRSKEVIVHDLVGRTSRIASVSSDGTKHPSPTSGFTAPGTSTASRVGLSADGRYVTFESAAPGLAPKDTNGLADVFVHDLVNRTTTLVSIRSDGSQFSEDSYYPSISGDGRIVAFQNDSSERQVLVHISAVAGRP
jgi:TolB protein